MLLALGNVFVVQRFGSTTGAGEQDYIAIIAHFIANRAGFVHLCFHARGCRGGNPESAGKETLGSILIGGRVVAVLGESY